MAKRESIGTLSDRAHKRSLRAATPAAVAANTNVAAVNAAAKRTAARVVREAAAGKRTPK